MKKIYIHFIIGFLFYNQLTISKVVKLKTMKEFNRFIKEKKPFLINFSAQWCGICTAIKEEFEEISKIQEFRSIKFAEIDIDQVEKIVHKQKIVGVPTFIFVDKNGNSNRTIGVKKIEEFKKNLIAEINTKIKGESQLIKEKSNNKEDDKSNNIEKNKETYIDETNVVNEKIDIKPTNINSNNFEANNEEKNQQSKLLIFFKNIYSKIIAIFKSFINYIKSFF